MKLRMTSSRTQTILSVWICAECIRVLRKRILRRVCGGNTKLSWLVFGHLPNKFQESATWRSCQVDLHNSAKWRFHWCRSSGNRRIRWVVSLDLRSHYW
jgi:hypothetical protein